MPPRLAQKIIAGRYVNTHGESERLPYAEQVRDAVLITANEACDALFDRHGGNFLDLRADFPCLAPPFERFWIEAQAQADQRWGVLFNVIPPKPEDTSSRPGTKWIVLAELFIGMPGATAGPLSKVVLYLDEGGQYLDHFLHEKVQRHGRLTEDQYYLFAFLAISLMHCKNVRAVEHDLVDSVTPKRERHPVKDAGLKYYTLDIDPMRQVLRTEGKSEEVGLKQALHLCRGHFKDYRQSGLFGKIKGIFWWDAFTRGTTEAGVVVKDYNVKRGGEA